jgi:pimeloyl-ACP methyl ester carboxylesterase
MPLSKTSKVLFLHGGPGLTCQMERDQYGDSLPVHWWDQPHFEAGQSGAFDLLVDAAVEEVGRLRVLDDRPVALVASSFGAQLAMALIARVPAKIGYLSIVGGILDLRMALVRLGLHVANQNHDSSLASASRQALQSSDSATLWTLIDRLFSVKDLLDFYWSPTAEVQRVAMNQLAATGALLHVPTYQAVLNDCITRGPQPPVTWRGSASVWIGHRDPYALPSDAESWRGVLPEASVQFVETGHFPHLELPASTWLPLA